MGALGVHSASYLHERAAAGCPVSIPSRWTRGEEFTYDEILRHAEKLPLFSNWRRFGTAIALIEQCIKGYEEDAAASEGNFYGLSSAIGTIVEYLPEHKSNCQPHAKRVDDLFDRLALEGKRFALKENQQFRGIGYQGELDIFGLTIDDAVISYEYFEVKVRRDHAEEGIEQVGEWRDSMRNDFKVPFSRTQGYLWLPDADRRSGPSKGRYGLWRVDDGKLIRERIEIPQQTGSFPFVQRV